MRGSAAGSVGAICLVTLFLVSPARGDEATEARKPKVIYPKETSLEFDGLQIQGEVRNPGEFYFARRAEEAQGTLVKRRRNFHREMLRDAVLGK